MFLQHHHKAQMCHENIGVCGRRVSVSLQKTKATYAKDLLHHINTGHLYLFHGAVSTSCVDIHLLLVSSFEDHFLNSVGRERETNTLPFILLWLDVPCNLWQGILSYSEWLGSQFG